MPPGTLREFGFVVGVAPGRPTGLGRMRCENDTWLFTAMGMAGHEPPNDLAGMCAFAEAFAPAHALAAVRAAQPMGEVARHRLASSQWRQYDKMRRFPDGLLVVGDAYQRFGGGLGAAAPPCPAHMAVLGFPTMIFLMHRHGIVGDDPREQRWPCRWAKVSALLFAIGAIGLRITLAHKPTLAEVSCPSVPPGQHGNPPRSADWSSPAGVGRAGVLRHRPRFVAVHLGFHPYEGR